MLVWLQDCHHVAQVEELNMQTPNSHEGETMVTGYWQQTHVNQLDKANKKIEALVDILDKLSESNTQKHALDKLTHKMLETVVANDSDHVTRIKRLESLVGDMALRITELEQINHQLHGDELAEDLPY